MTLRFGVLAVCLIFIVGCSAGSKPSRRTSGAKAAGKVAGKVAAAEKTTGPEAPPPVPLPDIDTNSGIDLDGKRVRVFSPAGWRRASKSKDYLIRYESKPQIPYPGVVVLAADPPQGFTEVTAANEKDFVTAIDACLAKEDGDGGAGGPIAKATAVTVGPHRGATWLTSGEAKLDGIPKKIDRECIAVVVNGRMYTVEAWAPAGRLDAGAGANAMAVAAALAVPSPDAPAPSFPFHPEAAATTAPEADNVDPNPDAPVKSDPPAKPKPPANLKPAPAATAKPDPAAKPKPKAPAKPE